MYGEKNTLERTNKASFFANQNYVFVYHRGLNLTIHACHHEYCSLSYTYIHIQKGIIIVNLTPTCILLREGSLLCLKKRLHYLEKCDKKKYLSSVFFLFSVSFIIFFNYTKCFIINTLIKITLLAIIITNATTVFIIITA